MQRVNPGKKIKSVGLSASQARMFAPLKGVHAIGRSALNTAGAVRLALLCGAVAIPWTASAQTAQIRGRVVDAAGAPIPDASVSVTNVETGIQRTLATNSEGNFTAPSLTRGVYSVTVERASFRKTVQAGLTLDEGQTLPLDFSLLPGEVSEVVQVNSAAPLLEAGTSTLSVVVPSQRIDDMPTIGRNPLQFALLVPGVRAVGSFGAVAVSAYSGGRASIAGGPVSGNNYMVDGIAAENPTSGSMQTPLSVDATEEFRIIVRNPAAEYGRTGGGIINLISKSGTNRFNGNLYEFNQNRVFNANNYFNKRAGLALPKYNFNIWGGTLGGPIKRDKTFFFFNYEQYSQVKGSTVTRTVPTDLQRQGDFSQTFTSAGALIKVYDPATTVPDPANPGSYIRTAFPGNIIPAARLSAVALAIGKYYPKANVTGVPGTNANNFVGVASAPLTSTSLGLRMDHYLSTTRRIAGRYSWQTTTQGQPNFFGSIAEPSNSDLPIKRHSGFLSYSDALRPNLFVDIRGGLNLYLVNRATRSLGFDQATLGFPASLNSLIQVPSFPVISNSDVSGLGIGNDQLVQSGKAFSYTGSLTWIIGNHTWKGGFENRMYQFNNTQPEMNMGFGFTRSFTQGPNPNTSSSASGFGYASFLLGTPASGNIGSGRPTTETEKSEALYLQDDWKVFPNLTLNLGMRWEYEGGITDRFNVISNFDPNVMTTVSGVTLRGGLAYPGVNGLNRGHRDAEFTNFQPRVGFAWQPFRKTVVRGGFGILYLPTTGLSTGLPSSGFSATTALVASVDGGITPSASLSNPFPNGEAAPTGSSLGPLTLLGQTVQGSLRNLRRGYSEQGSFSVQQEFPGNWLVEAGYVANRGVHLPVNASFDYLPVSNFSMGTALQKLVANPFYGIIPSQYALGKQTVPAASLLDTYPQYSGVTGLASLADSMYNAGTLRVERRFSHGLGLLLSYTFSKLIDDNSGNGLNAFNDSGSDAVRDWGNISRERAVSAQHQPHHLVISGSYELPFGKRGPGLYRQVAGGWQLNSIVTIMSGETISVSQNSPTYGSIFPNLVGDPTLPHPTISMWLNKAAFQDAPIFTLGNSPRNLPRTRTAAWRGADLSVLKNFPIAERLRLQFRAEAFNVSNTPIFGNPATNIDSGNFGTVSSLASNNNPRSVQLALKLYF